MDRSSCTRWLLAAPALLSVVSCTTLFNPYVDTAEITVPKVDSDGIPDGDKRWAPCAKSPDNIEHAIHCAQAVQSAYLDGMRNGLWVFWRPDGSIMAKGRFRQDRPEGSLQVASDADMAKDPDALFRFEFDVQER